MDAKRDSENTSEIIIVDGLCFLVAMIFISL